MKTRDIGIISLMSNYDSKSIKQVIDKLDKQVKSEVNGKFNAIGDEIRKQFESAMNVVQRPTLKNANITSYLTDLIKNIMGSGSPADISEYITDFTNRMESLHKIVASSDYKDLLRPLSGNQIDKLLTEADKIAELQQTIANRNANLVKNREQIIKEKKKKTKPSEILKSYVKKESGHTVDKNISSELSDFVSSKIDNSSEDVNKQIQKYQFLLNVFEKLNLEKKHMTEGSKELVGYNNQLQYIYSKILNIEKAIPELKEFRESLVQSDSKNEFLGRDLKYYETGTKWAADSYLKAQNRADNSKIKDIVQRAMERAEEYNNAATSKINADRNKAGFNNKVDNIKKQSNVEIAEDIKQIDNLNQSLDNTSVQLSKVQQKIANIQKMNMDNVVEKIVSLIDKDSDDGLDDEDIKDFVTLRQRYNELLDKGVTDEFGTKDEIDEIFSRLNIGTDKEIVDKQLRQIEQVREKISSSQNIDSSDLSNELNNLQSRTQQAIHDVVSDEIKSTEIKDVINKNAEGVPHSTSKTSVSDIQSEETSFDGLKNKVTQVTSEVDKKTQAFKEEEQVVTGTVQREINSLDVLIGTLVTIQEHIEKIKASATELQNINTGNVSSQSQTTITENSSNNNPEKLQNDLKTTQSNAETLNQTLKEIKENSTISIKIEAPEEVTSKLITQLEALKKILDNDWLSKVQELSKLKELKNLGITDKALDKFKNLKTGLDGIVKSFNKINDSGFAFLDNLTILAQQGEALKDLTTLLKTSQSQLTNARNTVNNNKNFIDEDVYDNNSEQWLKDNVDALSNNSKYIGVLDAEIARATNGMVKFTANVKNAKNEWQKLSGTVKADGSLTNVSLKNIQGKQANNLDNVLNGNSNNSQLSNKEDILKDIEKSLKTIYDYRVKIASTNDTDTLNDLQSKLSSEEQQYKQLVDNYKTNYSAHPNDLDDDFRNVVKPVKVKGRKNIRVASADAILDKITEQQAEVSKLKNLDGSIFKDEGDNSFDDYLQDQENKLNELIKKYKQYGDVVQDVQQKIEDAKVNGSNEGISQADTLRANYDSVNKIHGELQNGNQQGFLEQYYVRANEAVTKLIGKQQQGEEITKKELQNVQSLYNEYKKIANAGTPLADNIRGKVNADSYILNNAKQQGTIISQGEFKETDISKGLATTIIKIRNAKGEIRDLQYTWHDGMISMADNTKKVQTSLVGVPKIMDALSKKSKELITYWTANYINPYKIIEMIQKGVNIVKELDTALVDLRKTTTMSSTDLKDFYSDANEAAKEYGVTTKQIIDQASSWSRLGYSDKNSATEMAKLSSQFATISPGMDIDKATTGLVSTMKAKLCLCVQKCAYRKYLIAGNA